MTRDQAIHQGYADQVSAVDKVAPDYSRRVCPDPDVVEFTAAHKWRAPDGYEYTIIAYYHQDKDDLEALEDGDLGSLDWTASQYEVIL